MTTPTQGMQGTTAQRLPNGTSPVKQDDETSKIIKAYNSAIDTYVEAMKALGSEKENKEIRPFLIDLTHKFKLEMAKGILGFDAVEQYAQTNGEEQKKLLDKWNQEVADKLSDMKLLDQSDVFFALLKGERTALSNNEGEYLPVFPIEKILKVFHDAISTLRRNETTLANVRKELVNTKTIEKQLRKDLQTLKETDSTKTSQLSETQVKLEAKEVEAKSLSEQKADLEKQVSNLLNGVAEKQKTIQTLESEKTKVESELAEAKKQNTTDSDRIGELEEKEGELENEIAALKKSEAAQKSTLARLTSEKETLSQDLLNSRAEAIELKSANAGLAAESKAVKEQLAAAQNNHSQATAKVKELDAQVKSLQNQATKDQEAHAKEVYALKDRISKLGTEKGTVEGQLKQAQENIESLTKGSSGDAVAKLATKIQELEKENAAQKTRIADLEKTTTSSDTQQKPIPDDQAGPSKQSLESSKSDIQEPPSLFYTLFKVVIAGGVLCGAAFFGFRKLKSENPKAQPPIRRQHPTRR